jgi:hypothetical protein
MKYVLESVIKRSRSFDTDDTVPGANERARMTTAAKTFESENETALRILSGIGGAGVPMIIEGIVRVNVVAYRDAVNGWMLNASESLT